MGDYLSTSNKEVTYTDGKNEEVEYYISSVQGWRKKMEDTYMVHLKIGEKQFDHLFGVFDGHNGKEVSTYLKDSFLTHLTTSENYKNFRYEDGLKETFLSLDKSLYDDGVRKILLEQARQEKKTEDEEFLQTSKSSTEFSEEDKEQLNLFQSIFDPRSLEDCNVAMFTGSTACVCLFGANDIYLANLGNSQAIIFNKNKILHKTVAHNVTNDEEKKRIELAEGFTEDKKVNGLIEYCRSFGDLEYKQNEWLKPEDQMVTANPTVTKFPDAEAEFVVIGTNGFWENTNEEDVMKFVIENAENEGMEEKMKTFLTGLISEKPPEKGKVVDNKGYDNMSFIIIKILQECKRKKEIPKKDDKRKKPPQKKKEEEEKKEEKKEEEIDTSKTQKGPEEEKKEEVTQEGEKKETSKEEAKEEEKKEEVSQEEKKEEIKVEEEKKDESPIEEVKEEGKEEIKEETKEEIKEEPKEEIKEEPKEEVKEEPKEEPKEEIKEEAKEEVKKAEQAPSEEEKKEEPAPEEEKKE